MLSIMLINPCCLAIAAGACRHVLVFRTVAQATAREKVRHVSVLGGGAASGTIARGWQSAAIRRMRLTAPSNALTA